MDSLSTANIEFCLDVFKELNYNHAGDNVFFSPLSLLYALSVMLLGARGNSAEQMEKVLHFNHIVEPSGPEFKALAKGKRVTVELMHRTGSLNWLVEETQVQVLQLPYVNSTLGTIILLPVGTADVGQVEKQLNSKTFQEWTSPPNMVERDVEVHLPKFKLEIKYELNSLLESLGMTDIFSQVKADLSGISPVKGLFVSKVIHKSYVEVNEEGTEAAAATGDVLVVKRLPIRAQFVANHPFLFFIKHFHTNTILFCGKLASP